MGHGRIAAMVQPWCSAAVAERGLRPGTRQGLCAIAKGAAATGPCSSDQFAFVAAQPLRRTRRRRTDPSCPIPIGPQRATTGRALARGASAGSGPCRRSGDRVELVVCSGSLGLTTVFLPCAGSDVNERRTASAQVEQGKCGSSLVLSGLVCGARHGGDSPLKPSRGAVLSRGRKDGEIGAQARARRTARNRATGGCTPPIVAKMKHADGTSPIPGARNSAAGGALLLMPVLSVLPRPAQSDQIRCTLIVGANT